ncbi:hypothetical protein NDU88_007089 [Pleurodeles waltl]|uniref:Uncharacterized protein n=1 Tax=Pleurodeles waltl TaxID=8319 RepID=A0AAV7ME54_PLEWA|nr:hypothetical protein NDU88_007089 [Pleurodeles waltl]
MVMATRGEETVTRNIMFFKGNSSSTPSAATELQSSHCEGLGQDDEFLDETTTNLLTPSVRQPSEADAQEQDRCEWHQH